MKTGTLITVAFIFLLAGAAVWMLTRKKNPLVSSPNPGNAPGGTFQEEGFSFGTPPATGAITDKVCQESNLAKACEYTENGVRKKFHCVRGNMDMPWVCKTFTV